MSPDAIASNVGPFWRVHVANLLEEVPSNPGTWALRQPLHILDDLLRQVARRAMVLDDPELTRLMLQLTLYSVADPHSPDYDRETIAQLLRTDPQPAKET